jgi:hypothetical protein
MSVWERRQRTKAERDAYRQVARKALKHYVFGQEGFTTNVAEHANVAEDADGTGAFVECTIWVPRDKVEKESTQG